MTNKEIVLTALNKYFIELCTTNEIHNLETTKQIEDLITYISLDIIKTK